MVWRRLGVRGLAIVALAIATPATATTVSDTRLADLRGLDQTAVRARLMAGRQDGLPVPSLEAAGPTGAMSFATVADLLQNKIDREAAAAFRTNGDDPPSTPAGACSAKLSAEGEPISGFDLLLVFEDGRLARILRRPQLPKIIPGSPSAEAQDLRRARMMFPFASAFGRLPLDDGLGFVARSGWSDLGEQEHLVVTCGSPPATSDAPAANASAPAGPAGRGLDAGDLQGLAQLPFAATLPFKNAHRVSARRDGATVLASLKLGASLGAPPERYAADHSGVRAYGSDDDPAYAVLTIDMGAFPSRSLDNTDDTAMVGVRGSRVVWISPPGVGFAPYPEMLCSDDHNLPRVGRKGCDRAGRFSP